MECLFLLKDISILAYYFDFLNTDLNKKIHNKLVRFKICWLLSIILFAVLTHLQIPLKKISIHGVTLK